MPDNHSTTKVRREFNHAKPLPPISAADVARFWSKVDKTPGHGPNGECWIWTAARDKNGYGKTHIAIGGKNRILRAARSGARLHPERMKRGEENGNSKLTHSEVKEMRGLYRNGNTTYKAIAAKYGVSYSHVSKIIRCDFWKHID